MENQKQPTSKFIDCTGHFYGSRVSKSGQYLNVYVVAEVNGKAIRVCVPTSFQKKEGKPYAVVVADRKSEYQGHELKGNVGGITLFPAVKKEEPKAKEKGEDPKEKGEDNPLEETIPF